MQNTITMVANSGMAGTTVLHGADRPAHAPAGDARALIAWWSEAEGIRDLLGPKAAVPAESARLRDAWERGRASVRARPPFERHDLAAILQPLPPDYSYLATGLRGRADIQPGESPGWVKLSALVCIQRLLHQVPSGHGEIPEEGGVVALWNYCLPPLAPASLTVERSSRVVTYSSPNPNLRVSGALTNKDKENLDPQMRAENLISLGPSRDIGEAAGFRIGFGSRLVRVVRWQGRAFLANGYHRCYQLLTAGIHWAPALVADARSESELFPARRNFLPREVVFGPRPPFLRDYLDDAVSASVPARRILRKIIRITAEEFTIYEDPEPDARGRDEPDERQNGI